MKPNSETIQPQPLQMVGGSMFGRYPKISAEKTWNMLITDNWMVPFPGYAIAAQIDATGEGRAIYSSEKAGLIFVVINQNLYSITKELLIELVGQLQTTNGDVYIAENNANQIEICDKSYLYNYNYGPLGGFNVVPFPTTPAPFATITYSGNSSQTGATVIGSNFTVGADNITITSLGVYQNAGAGIFQGGNVQVGLYDSSGNLITSITVTSSVNPPGNISYVPIIPLVLSAGSTYSIIQTLAANAKVLTTGTIAFSSVVTFNNALSAASTVLAYTTSNTYSYTYAFGPTFQYATDINTLSPLHVSFQDTYFIVPASDGQWYLSANNNGLIFPIDSQHIGEFQTKPDLPIASVRIPGKGNKLLIFGSNVTEPWSDLGLELFPYQRDTFNNIDYGCLNPSSIAALENYVVWLAANEQSGPTIMVSDGQSIERLSTDGIGFELANLNQPSNCYAFLFRQYDHIIYVITFPFDEVSYCYDFTSKKFSNLSDSFFNAFIAKRVTFFNNNYYFISIIDGNLYQIDSEITTYGGTVTQTIPNIVIEGGNEIPMIRVTPTFRMPDTSKFIAKNANFVIEEGIAQNVQAVDLSLSTDGGNSFGASYRKILNPSIFTRGYLPYPIPAIFLTTESGEYLLTENGEYLIIRNGADKKVWPVGGRSNRLNFWNLGAMNELTLQFRFHGVDRVVFSNGELNIFQ